jgi:hypothetical protein
MVDRNAHPRLLNEARWYETRSLKSIWSTTSSIPAFPSFKENVPSGARSPVFKTFVQRITGRSSQRLQDSLAIEEPLEIQLGYGHASSRNRAKRRQNRSRSQCALRATNLIWQQGF